MVREGRGFFFGGLGALEVLEVLRKALLSTFTRRRKETGFARVLETRGSLGSVIPGLVKNELVGGPSLSLQRREQEK